MNLYNYHTNPKTLIQAPIRTSSLSVDFYDGGAKITEGYDPAVPRGIVTDLPKGGNRKELIIRQLQLITHDAIDAGIYDTEVESVSKKWVNWAMKNATKLVYVDDDREELQTIVAIM